jgi:hypothetical protein
MEDIGINLPPLLRGTPSGIHWQMNDSSLQYLAIFLMLGIMLYWCKNVKISTTKYMRGRYIDI